MIAKAPLHLQVIWYGKVHSKGSQGQNGNLHIKQGPLIPQNIEFTTPELCFGPASLPISSYNYTERLCTTHSWLPQSSLIGHSKKNWCSHDEILYHAWCSDQGKGWELHPEEWSNQLWCPSSSSNHPPFHQRNLFASFIPYTQVGIPSPKNDTH